MPEKVPETKRVSGYLLAQTEKAIQFECWELAGISLCSESGDPKKEWFPVSKLTKIHKTSEKSEMDYIEVATWLLRKKEML